MAMILSCSYPQECESPLSVVIKLQSAESIQDIDAAMVYIDVESVYTELAKKEGLTAKEYWKDFMSLGATVNDKKFTKNILYHDYVIEELIENEYSAMVVFRSKLESGIVIRYGLRKNDGPWVVSTIEYVKPPAAADSTPPPR